MKKLTDAQVEDVCYRYVAGESSEQLSQLFGVSSPAIRGLLKRRNIPRRTQTEAQTRYRCNRSFFAEINTETKAYWLGFIAADGSITVKGGFAIALARKDRGHLAKLASSMDSAHPVLDYDYGKHPFSRFYIRSPEITADLIRHGVGINKTVHLRWPEIPDTLQRHFLRGYVDGDGGFTATRTKWPTPNFGFHVTSNLMFLKSAQTYLMDTLGLNETRIGQRKEGSAAWTLRYSGAKQVERIAMHLYEDASIFLPRKLNRIYPLLNAARNVEWKYHADSGISGLGGLHVNQPIVGVVKHSCLPSAHKPPISDGGC